MALHATRLRAAAGAASHSSHEVQAGAGRLRPALAAWQELHLARGPVGSLLRCADDDGGLCAAADGPYQAESRVSAYPRQYPGLAFLRRRLRWPHGRDSVPRVAGHLSGNNDAGEPCDRSLQYAMGRNYRGTDLRAATYKQFPHA